jgi:uncharacterized membrane protein HdeD (DUF308 family)
MSQPSLIISLRNSDVKWGWILFCGLISLFAGVSGLAMPWVATFVSLQLFGWLLIFAGAAELIAWFNMRKGHHAALLTLGGIINVVIGLLFVFSPLESAMALTLLLVGLFIVGGFFRIFSSLAERAPQWGWNFFNGLVSVLLALIIYKDWPASSLVIIGLFISIELILRGWSWIILALALRRR